VLYLHTVGSPSSLYLYADTGERRPIHATALGKALLAAAPHGEIEKVMARGCHRYTDRTITTLAAMKLELARIRERGYAVDDEEGVAGLRCVAAAIRGQRNEALAAISISAPAAVMPGDAVARYAALVREAALKISVQMGYRPGTSNLLSLIASP
jgi:IclR family acetate operon transcriptional repressor